MAMIHVWNDRGSNKFTLYLDLGDAFEQIVFTFEDSLWRQARVKIRGTNQPVKDAELVLFTTHECQILLGKRLIDFNLTQQTNWPQTAYRYVGHENNTDMTYSRPAEPKDPYAYDSARDYAQAYDPSPLVRQQIINNIKNARKSDLGTTISLG